MIVTSCSSPYFVIDVLAEALDHGENIPLENERLEFAPDLPENSAVRKINDIQRTMK